VVLIISFVSVKVKWEWYNPDGSPFDETFYGYTDDPQGGYYDWWKMSSGWYIDGYGQSNNEGRNTVKIFAKEDGGSYTYHGSQYYIISYDFKEHQMCKDVQDNDPWNPITKTNIFNQNDERAYTWMLFEDVCENIDIKWEFFEPNGLSYSTFDYIIPDPGEGYYQEWHKAWGWIGINGNTAANKCGKWKVKVSEKNPWGSWDELYQDNFTILESPAQNPITNLSLSPVDPVENQDVTLQVTGSDNTYIKKIILYWNDGTVYSEVWDDIYQSSVTKSKNIGSYSENQAVQYYAKIFDTSGNQNESDHKVITIQDSDIDGPIITDIQINEYNGNNDTKIDDSEQVNISCNVSDPSGISSVRIFVDDIEMSISGNYFSISGPYTEGSHAVKIIATDNDNTQSSTTKFRGFDVEKSACLISGNINYYSNNNSIANADVKLYKDDVEQLNGFSQSDGSYSISDIQVDDYKLTPILTSSDYSCLSATDASRVARYSVGLYEFDGMMKIAADVSENGSISALDASRIARKVVGLSDVTIGDWIFVPQYLTELTEPIVFDPYRYFLPLDEDKTGQDFLGIRLGDVTGNWAPGGISKIAMNRNFANIEKEKGSFIDLPVHLSMNDQVEGIEFSFEYDPVVLEFVSLSLICQTLNSNNYITQTNIPENGTGCVVIYCKGNSESIDSDIANLRFQVNGEIDRTTQITITSFNCNEQVADGGFIVPLNGENTTFTDIILKVNEPIPDRYTLYQNYPNPFNPVTTFKYEIPENAKIRLSIYNIKGELVELLIDEQQKAGIKTVQWDASSSPSGIYYCILKSMDYSNSVKLLLLK